MASLHPVDELRLQLVAVRADLRALRQDLARLKRVVARQVTVTSKTAKDREAEREFEVFSDSRVMALEDEILKLQRREDELAAGMESATRVIDEERWFIRNRQADAIEALATVISHSPLVNFALSLVTATGDNGAYMGEGDYLKRSMR